MKRTLVAILLLSPVALVFLAPGPGAQGDEHAYVGTKNCKRCHLKEWRSWSETAMATSFQALLPGERADAKSAAGLDPDKDYSTDPTCVRCHVTGYGKEGGFVDMESTPELAGVGCEACHGPGGTYTQDGYMTLKNKEYHKADLVAVGLVGEVTGEQCVVCHNAESPFVPDDFVFDFAAKKDEGTHETFPLKYEH